MQPVDMRAACVMRRIAVISSDRVLERTIVTALISSAALARVRVEVVPISVDSDLPAAVAECDAVVVLGSARIVSGGLPLPELRRGAVCRPHIYVISWQLGEQTVLGLLECGIDQYMTFPLNLRRLCMKLIGNW